MATRTFEAQVLVHGVHDPYTVRVHADAEEQVEGRLRALIPALRRVWEFQEMPLVRATPQACVFDIEDDRVLWAGLSDTDAGPGHYGATSRVEVGADGEIVVGIHAPGIYEPFAPIDWKEEALALRAALRTTARELVDRTAEVEVFREGLEALKTDVYARAGDDDASDRTVAAIGALLLAGSGSAP